MCAVLCTYIYCVYTVQVYAYKYIRTYIPVCYNVAYVHLWVWLVGRCAGCDSVLPKVPI